MKSPVKVTGYLVLAATALLLSFVNVYAVKTLDVLGAPSFFALAILAEILFMVTIVYGLYKGLTTPRSVVWSVVRSAWSGVVKDPYIGRLRQTNSRMLRWIGGRLDAYKPLGLPLTVLVFIAGTFLSGFLGILQDVLIKDPLTRIDTRIANLVPSIRTDEQTGFFSFVTSLASPPTIVLMLALTGGILWYFRRRKSAALFVSVSVGAEVTNYVVKHWVGRTRPQAFLSLVSEDGYSFPSGHVLAATVIFGLFAYYLYRSVTSSIAKFLILITYISSVFLVALSRIYLGVHYPSDVIASVLFGGFILTLVIGFVEIVSRFRLAGITRVELFDRRLFGVLPVVVIFALLLHPLFVKVRAISIMPAQRPLAMLNDTTVNQLPDYSETLSGTHMEPISFIYIGYSDQIEQLFESHGWYKSDPSTLSNTLKALAVGFQNRQYLTAPVTPAYLDAKPQTVAFQKPTEANTLKQRHHTRVWRTDYVLPNGRPLWVATASFDDGVQFAGPARLPTHHIDPNIDAERRYIVQSLQITETLLRVVDSQLGKNAGGDPFYTDGNAVVVDLK